MNAVRVLAAALLLFAAASAPAAADPAEPHESWLPPGLDWNKAREVAISLEDNRFEPEEATFERGVPYRLVLRNVGQRHHDLMEPAFYHAVVLGRIDTETGIVHTPHVHSLFVRAGAEIAVYLYPVREGVFGVFCSVPGHREDGMEGTLAIRRGRMDAAPAPAGG
jgi:uncharacterized cupredoxin-like copper-binding protein